MFDPELSNKKNPILAGLTGLGEGLFQGFITRKKMDEESRQFNEKMAFEERQNSLLQAFKQKEYELDLAREKRLSEPQPVANAYEPVTQGVKGSSGTKVNLVRNILTNKIEEFPVAESSKESAPRFQTDESGVVQKWNPDTQTFEPTNIKKQVGSELSAITEVLKNQQSQINQSKIESTKKEELNNTLSRQRTYDAIMDSYDETRGAYYVDGKSFKTSKALRNYAVLKTANMPGELNAWERDAKQNSKSKMTQGQFIEDFKASEGREPSKDEITKAKQKGFWQ